MGDAWYKRLGKGALGVAFGTLQSIAPGGFLTDFVARPTHDSDFLVGQAAGQYATGGVQLISGGAAAAAGGGGTVVTAGAGSLVTVPVAAAGVAVAVQGASNVAAATNTLMQAQKAREAELLQMSGNGTGGGGAKATGTKAGSKIDRKAFRSEREKFWKGEAESNAGKYTKEDVARMKQGRAPKGPDGHPMELHHADRTPEGGIKPMSRTDHRLGENYKKNHPD